MVSIGKFCYDKDKLEWVLEETSPGKFPNILKSVAAMATIEDVEVDAASGD